jgi:hypothetical protein
LLVTARKLAHTLGGARRADAEPLDEARTDALLGARGEPAVASERGELRQRDVLRDVEVEREPLASAILAEETDALGETQPGRRGPRGCRDPHAAVSHRIEAENRAQELGAPRADEPRDAEHLAAAELE